jgi:hypothetical protein
MEFKKSTRAEHKYMVFYGGHWIHFGNKNYEQYKDTTPLKLYSFLDHGDKKRRESYLARAKGIKSKGQLTWQDKNSANYYSIKYLWGG